MTMVKRYIALLCLIGLVLAGCRGNTTVTREEQLGLKGVDTTESTGETVDESAGGETAASGTAGTTQPETTASTDPETAPETTGTAQTETTASQPSRSTPAPATAPTTAPTSAPTTVPTTASTTAPVGEIAEPEETTVPATQPEKDPYDISDHKVGALEQEILDLINAQRVANGLAELTMDTKLAAIAAVRAYECAESFSHTRPDGQDCFTALDDYGYSYRTAGENILMCTYGMSAEAMVDAWMDSEGHRANILTEEFTLTGIGVWVEDGMIYVANFFVG